MTKKQYVNLPKDEIFKDKDIDSIDRCGPVSVHLEIEKADKTVPYKLKITPVGNNNVIYNQRELSRNQNFRLIKGNIGIVDNKKIKVEDLQLPAAGGNKYKVEAKDLAGNVVSSSEEFEVHRKLFYQLIYMDDGQGNSTSSYSLDAMKKHSKKYYIDIEEKGAERKIPYFKTLAEDQSGRGNYDSFGDQVSKAFNLDSKLKDYSVAVVFSDYIADVSNSTFAETVIIGTQNPNCTWNAAEVTITGRQWLWHGLIDTNDNRKYWYIAGGVKYTDNNGNSHIYRIPDSSYVDLAGVKRFSYGGFHKVKIKIDNDLKALLNKNNGKLDFVLQVNVVSGWTNGFSWKYGGVKLITCARRVLWEDMPQNTKIYTWNHEIGHRFGMTAWGNSIHGNIHVRNTLPDGPASLYGENRGVNDNSHQGPHCGKGASYNPTTEKWSGTPQCVMFGANSVKGVHAPDDYCSECQPIVRKLDLS